MKLQKEIFLSFFLGFFLSFYFRAKIDHQKRMRWRKTSTNERNWKTKTKRKFCFCCCFFSKKRTKNFIHSNGYVRIQRQHCFRLEWFHDFVFWILFFRWSKTTMLCHIFFHTKFLFIFFYFWDLLLFDL